MRFGTPCIVFSQACSTGEGKTLRHSLLCARFTVQTIKLCQLMHVLGTVENPASSALFKWSPFVQACYQLGAALVYYDKCRFGTPWLKPTCIVGTLPGLRALALPCNGCQRHLHLRGKVEDADTGKQVWLTTLAGAYPPELCRLWAKIIGAAAPHDAWRQKDDQDMSPLWEAELCTATGCSSHSRTSLPFCPTRFKLPFRLSGKQRGSDIGSYFKEGADSNQ